MKSLHWIWKCKRWFHEIFVKKNVRVNFRNMISADILKKFREINLQFWFTKTVGFTEFSLQTIWEFLCDFHTVLSHTLGCQLLKFDVIWRIFFVVNEKSSFHTACFVGSMGKLALSYCVVNKNEAKADHDSGVINRWA